MEAFAPNPFTGLMTAAKAHALAHGAAVPILSPVDATMLEGANRVDVSALHALGVGVVPWTVNEVGRMRAVLALHPEGLISDRPDLLQAVVEEVRKSDPGFPVKFDVEGHRGARGLRPENTLPAYEAGLDHLISSIETDTGVTKDRQSILWHDQFLNPESCRRLDGKPYDYPQAAYFRDHTLADLQATYVCDKLHAAKFPDQRNDPQLSPVSVAFAAEEHLPSPYTPLATAQLLRFPGFYARYYGSGLGRNHPEAQARSAHAAQVHFNLETKILPLPDGGSTPPQGNAEPTTNHTVDPQTFVDVLCGAIKAAGMEKRADVQSFDFRTLQLIEEQHPEILTVYLTSDPKLLSSPMVPAGLRQ